MRNICNSQELIKLKRCMEVECFATFENAWKRKLDYHHHLLLQDDLKDVENKQTV